MSTTTEQELDNLIDTLSRDLHTPGGSHRSRYYSTYSSTGSVDRNRYSTASPRQPYRQTQKKGWYKDISKEMGTPRSITPILKQNTYAAKTYRPLSASSRSISPASRPISPSSRPTSRPHSPRFITSSPTRSLSPRREKNVVIGPVTEMVTKQEYFRHRDSKQGKPLPGGSEFMRTSWPYGLDDVLRKQKRQEPSADYREPPVNQWSKDNRSGRDLRSTPSVEDLVSYYQRFADRNRSPSPTGSRRARSAGATEVPIRRETAYPTTTQSKSVPSSPIPGWMKQLKHIVVEDMHVPVPPRFGTLAPKPRYPDRAEPPPELGPPCELCHKPITETRCIITENFKYHCWHFVCSFCSKTLQENDFLMAIDNKPYCNNCFKRTYP